MTATEILDTVSAAGGQLWQEGERLRGRLPETLRPLVDVIRDRKWEIIDVLSQRPAMPAGVRLVRWQPKPAPIKLIRGMTVVDTDKFIQTTLNRIEARLRGNDWGAGNWSRTELVQHLEEVGVTVVLVDYSKGLH